MSEPVHLGYVREEGVAVFTIAWKDEDGNAITPDSASWSLTDTLGNVINSRSAVTISSLSTSNRIVLEGDDLIYSASGIQACQREFLITYTYTSDLGELTQHDARRFGVMNLAKVS